MNHTHRREQCIHGKVHLTCRCPDGAKNIVIVPCREETCKADEPKAGSAPVEKAEDGRG